MPESTTQQLPPAARRRTRDDDAAERLRQLEEIARDGGVRDEQPELRVLFGGYRLN